MANEAHLAARSDPPQPSNSVSSVLSTLIPVLLVAIIWLSLFLVLRPRFKRNYEPRTFLGSIRSNERSPKLSDSMFGWFSEFRSVPDIFVLNHHSLDGYLFLRFLKTCVVCALVGCLITWPVLFPINITGGGGHTQLDVLTLGNVTNNYYKMFAHAGCAILFFGFLMFMITRESIFYINIRQAYLLSPLYASRMSSRTVLFTSVPADYMDEGKLRRMLGQHVRRVWFATDCKTLDKKVKERDKVAMKLEGAETKLIVSANGARVKAETKGQGVAIDHDAANEGSGSLAARYLPLKKRPTHRLTMLIGKKVDTIDWSRAELKKLIPEVEGLQAQHRSGEAKMLNSVFVEFTTLSDAQAAYQSLAHHHALHMAPHFVGMRPAEIIWSNLRIKWWELILRRLATTTFVCLLIIFWAIPVAVVGIISNIDKVISIFPWLGFINKLPTALLGLITSLLPVVLLAVLMSLVPIILRAVAKLGGAPTRSAAELYTQNAYFAFQVVQVFLVVTIGSSAPAVGKKLADNPSSAASILASTIPSASTIYLSYFVLQGLGVFSGILLGLVGLILFMVLGKLLDTTPRKMYKRWVSLSALGWGTLMPVYTNLFVIAIVYSCIAPLVLGFAAIGLFLFYLAYRYNLIYVAGTDVDTQGRLYPLGLGHLFVGIYIAEVCLIGLFIAATAASIGGLGPLILMIAMLVFTVLYQSALNAALKPLIDYLPKSLDAEERRLLSIENGENGEAEEEGKYSNGGGLTDNKEVDHSQRSAPQQNAPSTKKPSIFTKWLRPDLYDDYNSMRLLVPKNIAINYTPEDEQNAYYNPSISSPTPLLWIPRDPVGMSRQAVRDTNPVIPITDDGAYLDEKNKIVWDAQDGKPPVYQEVPYY